MKNKWLSLIIVLEVQIILAFVVYNFFTANTLEQKTVNTNKYVTRLLIDNNIKKLNVEKSDDIVLGRNDAPVTMYMYSKFGCSACHDFFAETLDSLKKEYLDKGKMKLVIRYVINPDKISERSAIKYVYLANEFGVYDKYVKTMNEMDNPLDSVSLKSSLKSLLPDSINLDSYMKDNFFVKRKEELSLDARNAGVGYFPSFYIKDKMWIGNQPYYSIKMKIDDILIENQSCKD